MKKAPEGIRIIAKNKKAFFEYHIEEKVEAGMMGRVSRGAGMAPLLERRYGLNPAAGAIR